MACSAVLENEFKWYLDNQEELLTKYNGKYVVIKDQQVIGAYDSEWEAFSKSSEKYEAGSFLIQKCQSGKDDYTATYHSIVMV